jgi:hypothetical protein
MSLTDITTSTKVQTKNENTTQLLDSAPTMHVPQGSQVNFLVVDQPNNYGDNTTGANDPAKARLGGSLDDFFAGRSVVVPR